MATAFCLDYPHKNHTNCPSSVECYHAVVFVNYLNRADDTSSPDDVVAERDGSWFIEPGFAGFNSPTNNNRGYASKARAIDAVIRYQSKVS